MNSVVLERFLFGLKSLMSAKKYKSDKHHVRKGSRKQSND